MRISAVLFPSFVLGHRCGVKLRAEATKTHLPRTPSLDCLDTTFHLEGKGNWDGCHYKRHLSRGRNSSLLDAPRFPRGTPLTTELDSSSLLGDSVSTVLAFCGGLKEGMERVASVTLDYTGLEITETYLPLHPECWDSSHALPYPAAENQ